MKDRKGCCNLGGGFLVRLVNMVTMSCTEVCLSCFQMRALLETSSLSCI